MKEGAINQRLQKVEALLEEVIEIKVMASLNLMFTFDVTFLSYTMFEQFQKHLVSC